MAKIHHVKDYKQARREEYPPLEDLADAIYHGVNGDQEPMKAYLEKVKAVKDRIRKTQ